MPERPYTPAQLAEHWQCSERHVRNLIAAGELEAFRFGSAFRIEAATVAAFERRGSVQSKSWIYLVQCEATWLVKIGLTTNPQKRLVNLERVCPAPLRLLARWPGRWADEQALHARFVAKRRQGEWFALSPADVQALVESASSP